MNLSYPSKVSNMASKTLLAFALVLAAAFLVSSTAEQTQDKKEEAKVGVQGYHGGGGGGYPGHGGGGGGYPGHGGGGYPGHGGGGGGYPGHGGGGGGYPGHGGGGSGCHHGCCSHGYHGGCRCCTSPDEVPEPMYRAEVRN